MKIDSSWYIKNTQVPLRIAAGGIVVRWEGDRLWLALTIEEGRYTELPKGGVEKGETLEQAARREVMEETGVVDLTLLFPKPFQIEQRYGYYKRTWIIISYFLYLTEQHEAVPQDAQHTLTWVPFDTLPEMFWFRQGEWLERERAQIHQIARAFRAD